MQRALGAALKNFKKEFEGKHEELKKESRVLRMARAMDEEMSMESIGQEVGRLLKDRKTTATQKTRLLKLALDLANAADVKTAEHDLANVDFDDLRAALLDAALEYMLKDEGMFLSVAYQVFQEKPGIWDELQTNPPSAKLIEVKVSDAD